MGLGVRRLSLSPYYSLANITKSGWPAGSRLTTMKPYSRAHLVGVIFSLPFSIAEVYPRLLQEGRQGLFQSLDRHGLSKSPTWKRLQQ